MPGGWKRWVVRRLWGHALLQTHKHAFGLMNGLATARWLEVLGSAAFVASSATVRVAIKELAGLICALLEGVHNGGLGST